MLKINLYKNNNTASRAYGKVYGRVENDPPMNLRELSKHMHDHNCPYDLGTIMGVLTQMVGCIRELTLEGKPVKIDDLAIFSCQVETTGAPSFLAFEISTNVKAIRMGARATGEFTRAELNKAGKVGYTSLAESLRDAERPQPEPEPDPDPEP